MMSNIVPYVVPIIPMCSLSFVSHSLSNIVPYVVPIIPLCSLSFVPHSLSNIVTYVVPIIPMCSLSFVSHSLSIIVPYVVPIIPMCSLSFVSHSFGSASSTCDVNHQWGNASFFREQALADLFPPDGSVAQCVPIVILAPPGKF